MMTDRLDFPLRYREQLGALLREYVPDAEVWAYGSRVNGRGHDSSDLNLVYCAVRTLEPLGNEYVELVEALEQSNIPISFQVHDWARLPESFQLEIERSYVVVQDMQLKSTSKGYGEWAQVSIGDLVDIKHGFAFKGDNIHDEPRGDVLLTPGNFAVGGGFKGEKFKFYDGYVPEEFVLSTGDLLVTMTDLSKLSDTLGYPALVPDGPEGFRYLHNQRLGKVSPKGTDAVDTRFLYYVMCTADYRHEILASATGTTVKHTSPDRIKQFMFMLPPLPEQRSIAHILGTLDDKIELNRRTNETLEAMARAIFQDWFVDFGPVRAKMEGREPYLPPELWDLFPDRLMDSELGEIPEGWEVKVLGEVIELAYGKALKAGDRKGGDIPVYGSNGQVGWHDEKLSDGPGIVVGRKGNPGIVTWAHSDFFTIDTAFYAIAKIPDMSLHFLFYALVDQDLPSISADSAVPGLNRNLAYMNSQLVPDDTVVEAFGEQAAELFRRRDRLETESHSLAAQRDVLLPMLVSGGLEVGKPKRLLTEEAP